MSSYVIMAWSALVRGTGATSSTIVEMDQVLVAYFQI